MPRRSAGLPSIQAAITQRALASGTWSRDAHAPSTLTLSHILVIRFLRIPPPSLAFQPANDGHLICPACRAVFTQEPAVAVGPMLAEYVDEGQRAHVLTAILDASPGRLIGDTPVVIHHPSAHDVARLWQILTRPGRRRVPHCHAFCSIDCLDTWSRRGCA